MSAALWLGGIALLLVAVGLELWRRSGLRTQRQAAAAFIDRQIAYVAPKAADGQPASRTPQRKPLPWEFFFERAGVVPDAAFYARTGGFGALLVLAALWRLGPLSAIVVLLLYAVLVYFRYWLRANRRLQTIVRQLPPFLDGVVRLLTVGNSLPAAFQSAAQNTEMPLRELLDRTVRQVQAGLDLDAALRQIARIHGVEELSLLSAIVDLSTRFGGRADQILARMAAFMRDREQAQNELIALSSETRLSAWVLALLPVCVSAFLMLANPAFFEPMLTQPAGQKMLLLGLVMECLGGFVLYRLARSI